MENSLIVSTMDDAVKAAKAMVASKYFEDANDAAKAITKILAGREMGFGPFAAMTGIHIIKGKPAIGSNLIAASIKQHPQYNFKIVKHDETICSVDFYERWDGKWENIGNSTFTMDDAKQAQLTSNVTWQKYPKNMLFSRAISNGAKWYCPDVFGGSPMYTPEEMGAIVDEDENIIEAEIVEEPQPKKAERPQAPAVKSEPLPDWVNEITNHEGKTYVSLPSEKLHFMAGEIEKALAGELDDEKRKAAERKAEAIELILAARRNA